MTRRSGLRPFAELTHELLQRWRTLDEARPQLVGLADTDPDEMPARISAYLLLRAWHDNPLAEELERLDAASARRRMPVMAARFEHRESHAPCIVPLSQTWAPWTASDTLAGESARNSCAEWLAHAWRQSWQRTTRQDMGAILFSARSTEAVAAHCRILMHQRSPEDGTERLLQFQDARIFQALWRTLLPEARGTWLGPISAWWSLAQPWGPWPPADYASDDAPPAQARWFKAEAPRPGPQRTARPPWLDKPQWEAVHGVGIANRIWAGFAHHRIAPDRQPPEDLMLRLLHQAQTLGLSGTNAQDYVYATWLHEVPEGEARERPWDSLQNSARLRRALAQLRREPQARLGSLLAEAAKVP